MENEQIPTTTSASSTGRQQVPQISVYSSLPDRQAVQVIQQALHRQPNTAAQYLQQMYAAQQQHLMLQTAALQQQHLSSAQLQSLAAVQQASLAANRQGSSPNGNVSQQPVSTQTTINLATSPAAAQLISRAQSVNSAAATGIAQQAVLLGNPTSPALTASQAQMYLRAQMAQQSNLVQVARTLGRAVPLSPQLIFTPTAAVSAVQPEVTVSSANQQSAAPQVQNLAIRSQQNTAATVPPQLQSVTLKATASAQQASFTPQPKPLGQGPVNSSKGAQSDNMADGVKKAEIVSSSNTDTRGMSVTHTASPVTTHPLITTGKITPPASNNQWKVPEGVNAKNPSPAPTMTSGNGNSTSSVTASVPQSTENKPPQAIVKPQILTHVIEGFVIQEGAEPFPMPRWLMETWPMLLASRKDDGVSLSSQCLCCCLNWVSKLRGINSVTWLIVRLLLTQIQLSIQVGRSSLLIENLAKQKQQQAPVQLTDKLPQPNTTDSEMDDLSQQDSKEKEEDALKLKCEFCGRLDYAHKFKGSKRFCSMACAKRYNVGCSKRVGLFKPDKSKYLQKKEGGKLGRRGPRKNTLHNTTTEQHKKQLKPPANMGLSQEDSSRGSDNSSYEEPLSPISASSSTSRRRQSERELDIHDMRMRDPMGIGHHFLPSDATKWNVEDVCEFIRSLPGCQEIADEFRTQEIDGQALLLLKEDHLMSAMNIKLGPALKIYARINMLKDS
ncbi:polyhomeotic-like protein 2 [Scyliorhinus canicula]|uniref:polyhomeotic-like protein 2 n=1 Tax=Scyliorhinus canicula TaxID=7830 RepID=UPI0018F6EBF9|nr:polyhomeotic-like protein 2 [Scyliorhinus canicula]